MEQRKKRQLGDFKKPWMTNPLLTGMILQEYD